MYLTEALAAYLDPGAFDVPHPGAPTPLLACVLPCNGDGRRGGGASTPASSAAAPSRDVVPQLLAVLTPAPRVTVRVLPCVSSLRRGETCTCTDVCGSTFGTASVRPEPGTM